MKSVVTPSDLTVACVFLTLLGAPQARATDSELCSAVLAPHVFNASSSNDIGNIMFNAKHAMCKRDLSTYQNFQRSAEDLQIGVEFAKIAFGLGRSTQDESGYNSATIQDICDQGEGTYVSTFDRSWQKVDRSNAVSAWEKCVELASEGVYVTVTVDPSFERFLLRVDDKTRLSGLKIDSIENDHQLCSINGVDLQFPYLMKSKRMTFSCPKDPTKSHNVAVNTASGDTYALLLPGTELTVADAERLKTENALLNSDLAAERTRIDDLQKRLSKFQVEARYVKFVTLKEPPHNRIPDTDEVGDADLSCLDDQHPRGHFAGYYGFFEDPPKGNMFAGVNHFSAAGDGTSARFKTYDLADRRSPLGVGTAFIVCSDTQE